MHDSGTREKFDTGAVRDTAVGKIRPDLISPYAHQREGEWLRLGAEKYAERNWEQGIPVSRCLASIFRHLLSYMVGDTSEDHMAAVRTNAGFIIHFEEMVAQGLLPDFLLDLPWPENDGSCPSPILGGRKESLSRWWGIRICKDSQWALDQSCAVKEFPPHALGTYEGVIGSKVQLWDSREDAETAIDVQGWARPDAFVRAWDGPEPVPSCQKKDGGGKVQ